MTPEVIMAKLRDGGARIAFDTNVLCHLRMLTRLCNALQRLNLRLESEHKQPNELIVCVLVHGEYLMDLKQHHKENFDHSVIVRGLQAKQLLIQDFTPDHALATGEYLGAKYSENKDWHQAKKRLYMERLGMHPERDADKVRGSGATCSATIDWFIIGHARAEKCILVSNDRGVEFDGIADRIELDTFDNIVKSIVEESR